MGKAEKSITIPVTGSVDLYELVETCCYHLEHSEMKELIVQLDLEVADYDFTEELAKHLIKSLRDEDPDNFDINKLLED